MANMIQNAASASAQAVAKAKKPSSIQDYIEVMKPAIQAALPSVMTPERFSRITLSALSANPKLKECTPQSFLGAMMTAAQLGLEPNTPLGQAYLIPFRNHGRMECQFQLGYKGLIDLAYRSGEVSIIQAHAVYENDDFQYELGLDPTLRHVPAKSNRGKPIAYYAMFKTKDGGYGFQVMSMEDVKSHAQQYSKSYGNGPWQTNFDEMAKKTMLRQLISKWGIMSIEMQKAFESDMAEIKEDGTPEYIDNQEEPVPIVQSDPTIDAKFEESSKESMINLPPDMTAANFGKVSDVASNADIALAIINMVFETAGMLAIFAARSLKTKDIVLTGNLAAMPMANELFTSLSPKFGVNFIIPEKAQFATAIGAAKAK